MPERSSKPVPSKQTVTVFSGGVGLGSYQAGAYEALHDVGLQPSWFAASSVGAVNAAIITGGPAQHAVERLREFWEEGSLPKLAVPAPWTGFDHLSHWATAIQARLFGVPGQFRPRLSMNPFAGFSSLYDLAPMRSRIEKLVDFGYLNTEGVRVTVATTDIETGDPVLFDTGQGDRIGIEHLMASCGYLPEFAPVEIDGRLLGDGGLSANAPIEPVLEDDDEISGAIFVVDLFARDGARPTGLEDALARRNDLFFGNQTFLRLRAYQRRHERRDQFSSKAPPRNAKIADQGKSARAPIFYLSYRAPPDEPGSEKPFDFSRESLRRRWEAGRLDMQEALRQLNDGDVRIGELVAVRRLSR